MSANQSYKTEFQTGLTKADFKDWLTSKQKQGFYMNASSAENTVADENTVTISEDASPDVKNKNSWAYKDNKKLYIAIGITVLVIGGFMYYDKFYGKGK